MKKELYGINPSELQLEIIKDQMEIQGSENLTFIADTDGKTGYSVEITKEETENFIKIFTRLLELGMTPEELKEFINIIIKRKSK